MPKYRFQCSNNECELNFDINMSSDEYQSKQICPDCDSISERVFTVVAVHQGKTIAQKKSGVSSKTIEHGKYMKDAREKRKRNYDPTSREAQSNELWVGSEVQDGVINAPEKK